MRTIIKKYLNEINELSRAALDDNNDFIDGYDKKIHDILNEISKRLINEITIQMNYGTLNNNQSVNKLYTLYYLLDEVGYKYANKMISSNSKWKAEAITRLFMMYLKVLHEVAYLLQGGFASAALARIRAIYEISVFLEIISNNDEIISEKFLKHCNSNRLKIAKSLSDEELQQMIKDQIEEFEYGEEFTKDYQWAKSLVGKGKITFKDLVDKTQFSEFYYMYVYCCASVHANLYNSIQGIDVSKLEKDIKIWVTTPSNEGVDTVIRILSIFSNSIISNYFIDRLSFLSKQSLRQVMDFRYTNEFMLFILTGRLVCSVFLLFIK